MTVKATLEIVYTTTLASGYSTIVERFFSSREGALEYIRAVRRGDHGFKILTYVIAPVEDT